MDGNGRWAEQRGLFRQFGHSAGIKSLKKIIKHSQKLKIKYLTVYAFSTENWKRSESEVNHIMWLLTGKIKETIKNSKDSDLKFKFLGDFSKVSKNIIYLINELEEISKNNIGMVLNIAFSYGSKNEILNATKLICEKVINNELKLNDLDENLFSEHLYTKGQPDVDLIIRTAGEFRISNFLLWQSAYAEIYVTKIFWPDFSEKDLDDAILEFSKRNRRFGK